MGRLENTEKLEEERLPKAVYFQCTWLLRDMDRLEKLAVRYADESERNPAELVFYMDEYENLQPSQVVLNARHRLKCINDALEVVPEEYRNTILRSLTECRACDGMHENTWKKWKHRFICRLAHELNLC